MATSGLCPAQYVKVIASEARHVASTVLHRWTGEQGLRSSRQSSRKRREPHEQPRAPVDGWIAQKDLVAPITRKAAREASGPDGSTPMGCLNHVVRNCRHLVEDGAV